MELLDARKAFDARDVSGHGRPTGVSVLGWVGASASPANGPLQAISGGTWSAMPIGKRLSLDIRLGGTRYVTGLVFNPADHPATPVSVTVRARSRHTGLWSLVGRCSLGRATIRCPIRAVQTDALRLEFDPGTNEGNVAVPPVRIDMKRIQ
jgi:hypothetical protein